MPHSLSAKKRVRQNEKSRVRNRSAKSSVRTQVKKFLATVETGNAESAEEALRNASRALDKAASKGILHKRTAARQKSRLAAKLKAARQAPTES